ncbi:MAG: hypothetical protein DMG93_06520 [Acidobacteria bacterium]|nr:MAG: hypothetical protein DMG93_06520 [Acidobacteriota bacterium]
MSKIIVLVFVISAALAATSAAQAPDSAPVFLGSGPAVPGTKGGMIGLSIDGMDATPVKGAPFCASIATEHTQTFADGNRIHTTDTSTLCRDSEGRTRREAGLNLLGAAAQKPTAKLITILDPIAGVRYLLDSESKTAHKMTLPPLNSGAIGGEAGANATFEKGQRVMVYHTEGGPGPGGPGPDTFFKQVFVRKGAQSDGPAPVTENLGDQTIDGIHATGTRITTTIPAGKMGNEQPITVTSERWSSSELKITVMTKHNDPWAGELKTQLTNVNTSEPDASLFAVPANYKVVEDKAGPVTIKFAPPPPAPEQ